MINILILSPLPALRAGLRALLSADPEIAVLGTASSLETLLADSPAQLSGEVDVIVATPEALPAAGGWPVEMSQSRAASLLLITSDPGELEAAVNAGLGGGPGEGGWAGSWATAWGAVSAEAPGEALQTAVHALAEGFVTVSPELLRPIIERAAAERVAELPRRPVNAVLEGVDEDAQTDTQTTGEHLTPRETDVLRLMAEGLTNKQIAHALQISEHTVKFHVSAIYGKLGVANRAEAVRKGARAGWLPI